MFFHRLGLTLDPKEIQCSPANGCGVLSVRWEDSLSNSTGYQLHRYAGVERDPLFHHGRGSAALEIPASHFGAA